MYRNDLIRAALVNGGTKSRAAFARNTGISINTVDKIWHGKTNIALRHLIKVCDTLGITLQEVFTPKPQGEQS